MDLYNKLQRGLIIDILRIFVAITVFSSFLKWSQFVSKSIPLGLVFILYSVILFIWHKSGRKINPKIEKLEIAADLIWIVLVSILLNMHVVLVALLILQAFGVSIHYGFSELKFTLIIQILLHILTDILQFGNVAINYLEFEFINSVYFIGVLVLTLFAWQKERIHSRNILDLLTDKVLRIKNSIELRKVLNFWDNSLSLEEYIYNITLDNIGMDGVFFVYDAKSDNLKICKMKGLEETDIYEITNEESLHLLSSLANSREFFYADFNENVENSNIHKLFIIWREIQKKYSSFAGFPVIYHDNLLGLIIVFSKESQKFNEQTLITLNKNVNKTSFALSNLAINLTTSDKIENKDNYTQEKLSAKNFKLKIVSIAAVLLGRMYCVDKCIIALFDEKGQELIIKGVFGSLMVPVESSIDLRENIIHQVAIHSEVVNLKHDSLEVARKFLGGIATNLLCVPLLSKSKILGVICLVNKHMELSGELIDFDEEDEQLLCSLAAHVGVSLENKELYDSLETSFMATIHAMVNALDARDPYTKGHSEQVARYALMIGKELRLNDNQLQNLRFAAILHDIGKIGVPEDILHKPAKLTPQEYSEMKLHSYIGKQILRPVPFFQNLLPAIYHHHERWDGQGYPDGLMEEEIPFQARILAVADAFDAIVSNRVYRQGREKEMAVNELIKGTAKQFDPQVVDAFLNALDKTELSKDELYHWKLDTIRSVYRDVLLAVTQGQLVLADPEELAEILKKGELKLEMYIYQKVDVSNARQKVRLILEEIMVKKDQQKKILLCLSETIGNMIKHANGGILQMVVNNQKIWFIIKDKGPGIKLRDIPKATLKKGFSTKKSLGFGFSILLELMDRVYLETTEKGTTVILEQNR